MSYSQLLYIDSIAYSFMWLTFMQMRLQIERARFPIFNRTLNRYPIAREKYTLL
jgi:hypothetical protein